MRVATCLVLLCCALTGCRCGPEAPTPVTFRFKNTSRGPVFVDDSDGRMGMVVQRNVDGQWLSFVEAPRCACLACDQVCGGCNCDLSAPAPRVRRIEPGTTLERRWTGVVQVNGTAGCAGSLVSGSSCLYPENPPLEETFRIHACYSPSAPGVEPTDGGPVPGTLPSDSILCVDREFRPIDGVVEVSPLRGADCTDHAQCRGKDELCFAGACTAACPAHEFPALGASWQVRILEPDDQGFFTVSQGPPKRWSGAGTVSSVLYQNGTLTLRLTRTGSSGEVLSGALFITLPEGVAVPLTPGTPLSATVIDGSSEENPENRAVVLRDGDGRLVLAAETGQQGRILTNDELSPFSVQVGSAIVGCSHDECGKRLFGLTSFEVAGERAELSPGEEGVLVSEGASYRAVNVSNAWYGSTHCELKAVAPYVLLREREGP